MGCRLRRCGVVLLASFGRADVFYPAIDEAERWDGVVKPVVVRGYAPCEDSEETCAADSEELRLDACVAGEGEALARGTEGWRSASSYDVRDEVHVQRRGQTRVVVAEPARDVTERTGLFPRLHAYGGETVASAGAALDASVHVRAAVLLPGDALFIPAYWIREKRALNDSCSTSTYAESASERAAAGVAAIDLDGLLLRFTPGMRARLLTRFLAALAFELQLDGMRLDDLGEWALRDRVGWMPSKGDDRMDQFFRYVCIDESAQWHDEKTKDMELAIRKTANAAAAFFRGEPVRPAVRALILLDYLEIVAERVFGQGALPGFARHCAVGYGRIRYSATRSGTKVLRDGHLPPQTRSRLPPVGEVGDFGEIGGAAWTPPRRRPATSGAI